MVRSKTRTRWTETRCMTEVEQGQRHGRRGALVAPCYVWSHFYYPLLIVNPPLGVEVQPTNAKESQVNITRPSMREKYIRCIRYKT